MGLQSTVMPLTRLRSQVGSVTAESALSLAGIFVVVVVFLQSLSLIVVFLQLQTATYEASQIASAFGSENKQKQQALEFLTLSIPQAKFKVEIQNNVAVAEAHQRIELLTFNFMIKAKSTSARWDVL